MDNIKWIFSGIGSELLILAISIIISGLVGYKIGVKKTIKQFQKARNNSKQNQIGEINNGK